MKEIIGKSVYVSGTRICPQCGNDEAYYDINFETRGETMICHLGCGYVREIEAENRDGEVVFKVHEYQTEGADGIHDERGGEHGQLFTVPTEEEIQALQKDS